MIKCICNYFQIQYNKYTAITFFRRRTRAVRLVRKDVNKQQNPQWNLLMAHKYK